MYENMIDSQIREIAYFLHSIISESKPRKAKPLNSAWAYILKNDRAKKQKVAENEPWRCKYCKDL